MKNKAKSQKPKSTWVKLKNCSWYIKIGVAVSLACLGYLITKALVNSYNVSLLDKAEVKMKQLNIPKADYTTYRRSCSFRSVKFGGAGSPICDVIRTDVFFDKTKDQGSATGLQYLRGIKGEYEGAQPNFNSAKEFVKALDGQGVGPLIQSMQLQNGLECYTLFVHKTGDDVNFILKSPIAQKDSSNLLVNTSCFKRFTFQTYPER